MGTSQRGDSGPTRPGGRSRRRRTVVFAGGLVVLVVFGVFVHQAYRGMQSFMNPAPIVVEDSPDVTPEAQRVASFFGLPESLTHVYCLRDTSLFGASVMRAQFLPEDFAKYQEWLASNARDVKAVQSLPKLPLRPAHVEQVRAWWPVEMTPSMRVFEFRSPFNHVILDQASCVIYVIIGGD